MNKPIFIWRVTYKVSIRSVVELVALFIVTMLTGIIIESNELLAFWGGFWLNYLINLVILMANSKPTFEEDDFD